MAVREIRVYPDEVLRALTREVDPLDPETRRVVDDLFDTMAKAEGLGLAAPQIGESVRVFVTDLSLVDITEEPRAFINPVVTVEDEEVEGQEGCLSFPGLYLPTKRAEHVVVRALDINGDEFTLDVRGLFARAISHENDHLHGRLFVDRQPPVELDFLKKQMVYEPYVPPHPALRGGEADFG